VTTGKNWKSSDTYGTNGKPWSESWHSGTTLVLVSEADFVSGLGLKGRLDTASLKQKGFQVRKPRAPAMSKEAMREESERLVKEAMARKVPITQGKTRIDVKCSKCGAPNRVSAESGQSRVEYACKDCGHRQTTF
jgi:DNA-directed RNA polymerase subunit RPC12/RpoP